MSENTNRVELHGCIVCGRLHNLLVVTSSAGKMVGCTVLDPDCHAVSINDRTLVACNEHSEGEIKAALSRHHPGPERADDLQDD